MTALVLFDVDGTLLSGSGGTHVKAFAQALSELHGSADPFEVRGEALQCAGATVNGLLDAQVMRMCLKHAGVTTEGPEGWKALREFRAATVAAYLQLVEAGWSTGELLPGVVEVLDELARRGAHAGLLTGNTEEICAAKMVSCGLEGRFAVGGFGGELTDRSLLFDVALDAARSQGWDVDALCYVGDTPLDVDAARRASVPLVTVCTGRHAPSELARADAVLDDLAVPHAVETLVATAAMWRA